MHHFSVYAGPTSQDSCGRGTAGYRGEIEDPADDEGVGGDFSCDGIAYGAVDWVAAEAVDCPGRRF